MGQGKGALLSATKAGGRVHSIELCKTRAPQIAADISQNKGWRVARTRLKTPSGTYGGWMGQVVKAPGLERLQE